MPALNPYSYQVLDAEQGETRLILLHAGQPADPIRLSIIHAYVPVKQNPEPWDPTSGIGTVKETLPIGWDVAKTVDDRLIFHQNFSHSSWTHPISKFGANYTQGYNDLKDKKKLAQPRQECPEFEALSYCWGPSEPREPLIIIPAADVSVSPSISSLYQTAQSALLAEETFSISSGPNLASALRHLRFRDKVRRLWVDAICINQNDDDERGVQVARMGNIYRQAATVTVWLGEQTEKRLKAFELLEKMGHQIEMSDTTMPAPDADHPEWLKLCPLDQDSLEALQDFLALPWFSRVWIWQEIVLGSSNAEVWCGQKMVPWYFLRRGLVLLRETHIPGSVQEGASLLPWYLQGLPYCHPAFGHMVEGPVGLVSSIAKSACTDSRDRLYGVLGLTHPGFAERITPDYRLNTAQVYTSMVDAYIAEWASLEPLKLCDLTHRQLEGSPSWVPDLSNLLIRPTHFTFASGRSKCKAKILDDQTLRVLGAASGVVIGVSSTELNGIPSTDQEVYEVLDEWYRFASQYCHPERLVESFFTGIFFGWVFERRADYLGRSVKLYGEDLLALRTAARADPVSLNEQFGRSELIRHFKQDPRQCSFICTDQGEIGLGPIGVRRGTLSPP